MSLRYTGLTITKDRVAEVLKTVQMLTQNVVMVGLPEETAARPAEPGQTDAPNNPTIAYIHEFGSPAHNIPARPFLVPGVEGVAPKLVKILRKGGEDALKGDKGAAMKAMRLAGVVAQDAVQHKIETGAFAPLSPRTIAEKTAKGQPLKALMATLSMRNAVTFVIKPKD